MLGDLTVMTRAEIEARYPIVAMRPDALDSVFFFNACHHFWNPVFREVKDLIAQGLRDKQMNPRAETNALGWDGIIPFFENDLTNAAWGILDIETRRDVQLTGGHGRGDTWEVRLAGAGGAALFFGAVPGNAHGRNDRALNGTRGYVRAVIDQFNQEIENRVAAAVDPL